MLKKITPVILVAGFGVFDPQLDPTITLKIQDIEIKKSDITKNPFWDDLQKRLSQKHDAFDTGYLKTQEFLFLWNESRQKLFTQVLLQESTKAQLSQQDFLKELYAKSGNTKPSEREKWRIHDALVDQIYPEEGVKRSFSKPKYFEQGEFSDTLVFFGDLFCEDCRKWISTIKKLKEQRSDLKVLFRPFFPQNDDVSRLSFEAGFCAESIDKNSFWKFLYAFIEPVKKDKLEALITKIIASLGIDEKKFKECFASRKFEKQVNEQLVYAHTLGIKAPPVMIADGFVFAEHPGDRIINEIISDSEFFNNSVTPARELKTQVKLSWWRNLIKWLGF